MSQAKRSVLFYLVTIAVFGAAIYGIMVKGEALRPGVVDLLPVAETQTPGATAVDAFLHTLDSNMHHPLAVLIIQVLAIIAAARSFAYLFNKLGQPSVLGEIVAGIVLGPSVVGYWFPDVFHFLFPEGSLVNLQFMSQIGLMLFMFVVGMELDLKVLSKRAQDAVVISHASIVIPYALGVGLAYFLYLDFAPPTISFSSFALFMGIAMSITAFPVLARIIQERGLSGTRIGTVAIACAAADDVTAWCILAAVIAIVKAGSAASALFTIGASLAYVLLMIRVVRPFLVRLGDIHKDRETISRPIVALLFLVLFGSAYLTEMIGIHALFGAFLAGAIMPPALNFRKVLINKMEDISLVLLLPLFFVFTGLRTRIGLLDSVDLWLVCGAVVGVAVLGKFGGSALAARFTGNSWKDSLSIGALMNTRGLMELIVLNIGYDLGVLSPKIFVMMVLMALLTTFMTGPALDLIARVFRSEEGTEVDEPRVLTPGWRVLVSFGQPQSGSKLLRLAGQLARRDQGVLNVTALHLSTSEDLNPIERADVERESFEPVKEEAKRLGLPLETVYKVSSDISRDIVQVANSGGYDLMLVGSGKPLLRGTLLGDLLGFTSRALDPSKLIGSLTGQTSLLPADDQLDERVRQFIEGSQCSVGIFLDKGFTTAKEILLPIFAPGDLFLFNYAERFMRNVEAKVTVLDVAGLTAREPSFQAEAARLSNLAPDRLVILDRRVMDKTLLDRHAFLLIGYASWTRLAESRSVWLANVPSTLIVKP
ncbi:MAG: cation:proton antiporter [Flavobacteriales bacterium]|nr:cation:proton antiporter [Flavobacteriales bacterium]HRH67973.1 cation:proton antiporter [Flavobacteriales bacterium]